jgi:hypothetical protein
MKIRPVETELLHVDEQTDGRTDRLDEAISFFGNFAKATKNCYPRTKFNTLL